MLNLPTGYRANALGLIVPEDVSRDRQTWTWQEWRDLEKVTKFLERRGIRMQFQCTDPRCQKAPMTRVRTPSGDVSFRCEHMDRTVVKAHR